MNRGVNERGLRCYCLLFFQRFVAIPHLAIGVFPDEDFPQDLAVNGAEVPVLSQKVAPVVGIVIPDIAVDSWSQASAEVLRGRERSRAGGKGRQSE